ncbi:hypothetical protein SCAR479_04957 [Seiridium cardinale]|uniref:AB hydrolase-1 domain-containing protein n=1 Tax=Seiridium cardinale TaxID=138064 RepID=A0ABR2Y4T4_9PEZI
MATVVIVPGSFSPTHSYDIQTESLSRHGIPSVVVSTPSVSRWGKDVPPATMSDDADEIVRVVEPLLAEGKKVVLLAHSYGGVPLTQSLERLSRKARSAQGKSGGIESVIYLTAIVLPVGASNVDGLGGKLPEFVTPKGDYMTLDPVVNGALTFSDLPTEQGLEWANKMAGHSTATFQEKLTYAGYNDVNAHYIVCEQDKIIPQEAQYGMIELIKTSSGRDVTVHKLDSGHAPIISQPENVSIIAKKVIEGL